MLNGVPGEFITVAPRRGKEWFPGSMTNWTPRVLDIPLTFLGEGRYTAEIYADAADADKYPKNVSIRKQTVDRVMHLKAELAPAGGLAVRFVPIRLVSGVLGFQAPRESWFQTNSPLSRDARLLFAAGTWFRRP